MFGLVPGAGRDVTLGLALGVAGDDGGGPCVLVVPKVIWGGDACAVGTPISLGFAAGRPIATIAIAAPTPIAASADLYETVSCRCRDLMSFTLVVSNSPLAQRWFIAMKPDWHGAGRLRVHPTQCMSMVMR